MTLITDRAEIVEEVPQTNTLSDTLLLLLSHFSF